MMKDCENQALNKYEESYRVSNGYDTPPDRKESLLFRLLFRSRWYFYFRNFRVFADSGRLGREGKLDSCNQRIQSGYNMDITEDCGGKIHIRGLENLAKLNGETVVLIGNHMSLLETAVLHAIVRPYMNFTFVIKESLTKIPFFRDIMSALKAIVVGRANPRDDLRAVLTEGKARLEENISVIVFPQSTRSAEFDPEKFSSIGVKLAKSAGVKILPFALKTDFLQNGKLVKDLGRLDQSKLVCFEFGEAFEITGNGKEEMERLVSFISDRLAEFHRLEDQMNGKNVQD